MSSRAGADGADGAGERSEDLARPSGGRSIWSCGTFALRLQSVDHPKEPPDDTKALYLKLFEDRFGRWGMAKLGARKLLGMKI